MTTHRHKIEVNSLQEGMFVADLDRPWHETPFPLQGFYIQKDDDVKALSGFCKYVYIDVKKQKAPTRYSNHMSFNPSGKTENKRNKREELSLPPVVIKTPEVYQSSQSINKELSRATKLHQHVYEAIEEVFLSVRAGDPVSIAETERVAGGMVESVIRNPDALVWLAKMQEDDAHNYQHCVNASIWGLVFGRHLGLSKKRLKDLAMGILLSQIGKTKIRPELLEDPEYLDGAELHEYQSYVQAGAQMLEACDDIPKGVARVVQYHQERHNGSGFPQGLMGDRIPLLAKVAGLVDTYQGLITPADYAKGLSPLDAVTVLYGLRDIEFQKDLVERFIEAVGVYPTGTLVELSNAQVGIVTKHNQQRRLMPQIMVVLDENKQPLKHGKVVDLMEYNQKRHGSEALFIRDSLPKGAYDIDENAYLLTGAKSKWSWQHIKGTLAAG